MYLSSNAFSLEIDSTTPSFLEKLKDALLDYYLFEEKDNSQAIIELKINLITRSEFEKLENDPAYLKIPAEHEMFWSLKKNEAFFLEDQLLANPKNFFVPAICLLASSKNISFFHASCCSKKDNIFFFLGASTSGKSSFAYMLYENGYKMAGDDIIFLEKDGDLFRIFSLPRIVKFRSETLLKNRKEQNLEKVRLQILEHTSPKIFIFFPIFNIKNEDPVVKEIAKIEAVAKNLQNSLILTKNKNEYIKKLEQTIIKNTAGLINDSISCYTISYNDQIFCDLHNACMLVELLAK